MKDKGPRGQLARRLTDAGLAHAVSGLLIAHLGLRGCVKLTPAAFETLQGLRGVPLTGLDLGNCPGLVTNSRLAGLRGLPLTSLSLRGNPKVSTPGLEHLRGMPLKTLSLKGCFQNPPPANARSSLEPLRGLPLTSLDLGSTKMVAAQYVGCRSSFLKLDLPLTSLNLRGCDWVEDSVISGLKGTPLNTLDLGRCKGLTHWSLCKLRGLRLTSLSLLDSPSRLWGRDWVLEDLPLTSLDMGRCRWLSDFGLDRQLQKLPLARLNLAGCDGVSAEGRAPFAGLQAAWDASKGC